MIVTNANLGKEFEISACWDNYQRKKALQKAEDERLAEKELAKTPPVMAAEDYADFLRSTDAGKVAVENAEEIPNKLTISGRHDPGAEFI